ncbi:head GIN domain-containing protein [Algibacter aquimarinus]|uniref:Head GIN domain-containing protein n=1 Tax=Algibacter aquimarinus TaxID=1136748 RepID=A0ABP9HPQ0_9FLAO
MRKTITLSVIFLMLVSIANAQSWGKKKIKGNGNITTETRNVGDYNGIKSAGSMDIILVYGKEGEIKIKGDSNLLEYIVTEVKNDNLIIKLKKGSKISYKKSIEITVPFESINKVSLAGSGDIVSRDVVKADKLSVSVAGSGEIKLDIKTNYVVGAVAGSGEITLTGATNNLNAKVAGSGDFHGFGLQSDDTEVAVAGSGDAEVVSNKNLIARVSGSGDIRYKGNPKKDAKVSGSGSIKSN